MEIKNSNYEPSEEENDDYDPALFNARVKPDEMIITIAEYQEMQKQIEDAKTKNEFESKARYNLRNEVLETRAENEKLLQENTELKKGIINLIKKLGGLQ